MKKRNPKTTVFILSTIATLLSGILAIGLIFLFKYIESLREQSLPAFVWGIILILLCFSFAVFYILGYKIYEKRSIHDSSLQTS